MQPRATVNQLPETVDELIEMANMYASVCSRQEEKYKGFQGTRYPWNWEDCQAAFELVRELPNWYTLVYDWRKQHICRVCGFPNDGHAWTCERSTHTYETF